jgi:AcrR family transcriptional regulator
MSRQRKQQPSRRYSAPKREAAAARTRESILVAAKSSFEQRGWHGATVREIANTAGVSQKTVEAIFGTKARLLQAVIDYAIRGDAEAIEMPQRDVVAKMEAVPTAAAMLTLHATHLRTIHERSSRIASTVEQAASGDTSIAELWKRMNHNRRVGVLWATDTLLAKPGRKAGMSRRHVEAVFWVALNWGTFRTLTEQAGLDADSYESWLRGYYRSMLLAD